MWINTSMSKLFPGAPLAGPRRQRIGYQPVVAGVVPEVGARRRVVLHAANNLQTRGKKNHKETKKRKKKHQKVVRLPPFCQLFPTQSHLVTFYV